MAKARIDDEYELDVRGHVALLIGLGCASSDVAFQRTVTL